MFATFEQNTNFEQNIQKNRFKIKELLERKMGEKKSKIGSSLSYTRTVSGLTFHYHSTNTTIDQQFILVPLPNLQQSVFIEASFTDLSGIHGCLDGL